MVFAPKVGHRAQSRFLTLRTIKFNVSPVRVKDHVGLISRILLNKKE